MGGIKTISEEIAVNTTDRHPYERRDHPVVVGVDGSESALHAVRWAALEAANRNTSLRLVHVSVLPRHGVAPPPAFQAAVVAEGKHWLDDAGTAARLAAPGVPVTMDLRVGAAVDVLLTESRSAQLMVLGSRGLGGFRALVVGSVAVALAAHGHCPVVVMHSATRHGAPPGDGPVVVGVDGSELSDAAVRFAFEAAAAHGTSLVAVHTWLDVAVADAWTTLPGAVDRHQVQAQEAKRLDDRLTVWRDKFPGVPVRPVVRMDRPDRALLEQASGAWLLVVGSHGREAFAGMGVSSVSQTLLHHAQCPVAVARTERT